MLSVPLRRRAALALVAAAGVAIMTGCAATSPAIITDPYLQADGTNADLPLDDGTTISLRNFVVVLEKKGGAGQVVGAVTYSGDGTQPLAIEAKDTSQVPAAGAAISPDPAATADPAASAGSAPNVVIEVTGGELSQIGPEGAPFVLPVVNVEPGQYVQLTATSPVTGSVVWDVPVVAPTHYYAGLTATAAPSPTGTPTAGSDDAEATTTTEPETTTSD